MHTNLSNWCELVMMIIHLTTMTHAIIHNRNVKNLLASNIQTWSLHSFNWIYTSWIRDRYWRKMPPSNHFIWQWIATFTNIVGCIKIIYIISYLSYNRYRRCYNSCVRFENGFCYLLAIVMIWTIGRMSLFDEMKIYVWELAASVCDNNKQLRSILAATLLSGYSVLSMYRSKSIELESMLPSQQLKTLWNEEYIYISIKIFIWYIFIEPKEKYFSIDWTSESIQKKRKVKNHRHLGTLMSYS